MYRTVDRIVVQYHCRSDVFNVNTAEKGLRIVRSGAVEIRDSDNKLLDRLGEGESFHIGGLNAERGEVQATVIEDALLYLLPDQAYRSCAKAIATLIAISAASAIGACAAPRATSRNPIP